MFMSWKNFINIVYPIFEVHIIFIQYKKLDVGLPIHDVVQV